MLERLRKMSSEAKKKVVALGAGFLTFIILALWLLHSSGLFYGAWQSASAEGVALFSFLDQNVEAAYNAFEKNMPSLNANTEATTSEIATSTNESANKLTSF